MTVVRLMPADMTEHRLPQAAGGFDAPGRAPAGLAAPFAAPHLLWLWLLAIGAVAVAPMVLVEIPGLGDYLNHLARMHVIADYNNSPHLRALYGFDLSLRPYLAMEAIVPILARWMPIYDAGRVFIALSMLLPVLGAIALHRAASGAASATPTLAFLLIYNGLLSWGFLNYLFAAGLALLLLAGWVSSAAWPPWRRVAVFAVAATLLYLSHLIAFGAYCFAVLGLELAAAWRAGRGQWRRIARDWGVAAAQAIPGTVLLTQLDVAGMTVAPALTAYGGLAARIEAAASPFVFLGGLSDLATQSMLLAVLAYAVLRRGLRLSPVLWPAAAAVAILAVLMPEWGDGTWGMHIRLPLVAAMVLIGACTIRLTTREQTLLLACVAALVAVRSAAVTTGLRKTEPAIQELRALSRAIPSGARVLVAQADPAQAVNRFGPWRMTAQMAMVVLIERDVFIPYLFSGVPLVRPRPELLLLSTPHGHPISRQALDEGAAATDNPATPVGDGFGRRVYSRNWPANFDYLVWQHFGAPGPGHPDRLDEVVRGTHSTIYRVRRAPEP